MDCNCGEPNFTHSMASHKLGVEIELQAAISSLKGAVKNLETIPVDYFDDENDHNVYIYVKRALQQAEFALKNIDKL